MNEEYAGAAVARTHDLPADVVRTLSLGLRPIRTVTFVLIAASIARRTLRRPKRSWIERGLGFGMNAEFWAANWRRNVSRLPTDAETLALVGVGAATFLNDFHPRMPRIPAPMRRSHASGDGTVHARP